MIKNRNSSYGVMVYGLDYKAISNFYNFKKEPIPNISTDFLYIGDKLSKQINLSPNDNLALLNIEEMISNNRIIGINSKISGIFETNIGTFDNQVIFLSVSQARKLLNVSNDGFSGIFIDSSSDFLHSIDFNNTTFKNIEIVSWKDKHSTLLYWLTIFSNPIKLLLIFILFLAILYSVFTFWLFLIDKRLTYNHFKILGFTDLTIQKISICIILFLSVFSILLGVALALFFSYLQNIFSIITLDSSIYIISKIPIIINYFDIISLVSCVLIVLLFSGIFITYGTINRKLQIS